MIDSECKTNRLYALRKKLDVSRAELSRRTGIAYASIWKHEVGQHVMTSETAARYAEALGVEVVEIYIDLPIAKHDESGV
jgi:DNA-binding XRE family transcriptional regulator